MELIQHGNKKLTPELEVDACKMLGTRSTQSEVAEVYDVSQSTIHRLARKEDSQKIIRATANELLDTLPDVVAQTKEDFKTSGLLSKYIAAKDTDNPTRLTDMKDILSFKRDTYKKQADIMRMAGVFPSQSPSIVVNQMFNDNRTQVLSPGVADVIGKHLVADAEGEVVSSEVVEDE